MKLQFPGSDRSTWRDGRIEIVHRLRWDTEGRRLVSTITIKNLGDRAFHILRPLIMSWARGSDKNNFIVRDGTGAELRILGAHSEFRLDPVGRQMRPLINLQAGEMFDASFDLSASFEEIGRSGMKTVEFIYFSDRDRAYVLDEKGQVVEVDCWRGRADLEPLAVEFRPD